MTGSIDWALVWERASKQEHLVAGRWSALGRDLGSLADSLLCDELTAIHFSLLRAPLGGEDLHEWAQKAAQAFGTDVQRTRWVAWVCRA